MSFDLSQLLQGSVRDAVLNQVTKQLGVSSEAGGNLLNKGLSMVLGGMAQKASGKEGISGLFNLIKNSAVQGNPMDLLNGNQAASGSNLLEIGKNILPSVFGDRADAVTEQLATSTNTTPVAAKGVLGMLLPMVFSFFKGKILSGLGLGGFAKLLSDQTKSLAGNLDAKSLSALGFSGGSLDSVLGGISKAGAALGGATGAAATAATAAAGATAAQAKSSGWGKWLVAGGVVLAALFGIKSCSGDKTEAAAQAPATTVEQPAQPAASAEQQATDGLGDLAWNKTANDFTVSGTVQNDDIKGNILGALKGLAGDLPLVDKLTVDANAPKFGFNNFAGLADTLKAFPNVNGSFADKVLNLAGQVANADDKASLADKAKAVLGDAFSINTDGLSVANAVEKLAGGLGNLAWNKTDKDLTVSGNVPSEETKTSILDAFKGLAGELPLVDKLTVDGAAKFGFDNFAALADVAKSFPNVNGAFADNVFNLVGQVADTGAKAALVEKAKALLGDSFTINDSAVTVAAADNANATNAANADKAEEADVIADMSQSKLDLAIVFNTGSYEIGARYHNRLNAFAKYLIENNRGGEIAGFTDNVGNAASNQKLSEKRANAVRDYLIKQGVPADSLTAKGYGQENPIADNSTKEGRDKNRRIEFNAR